jgi:hypothetical protein
MVQSIYAHKVDPTASAKGIWYDYEVSDDGAKTRFLLSCASQVSNKNFKLAYERLSRPYRAQLRTGTLSNDVQAEIYRRAFAQTIVLGWENVVDDNGKQIEFTPDNVYKVLTDVPELFNDLVMFASNAANYSKAALENDAKN